MLGPQYVQALGLKQHLLEFLDIFGSLQPLPAPHAQYATEHLRYALKEQENAGRDDDRLELEDRHAGWTVGTDLKVAPTAFGIFPAGDHERRYAGKEEDNV
ncbi:hypothetical protein D3C72_1861150 [compost metagenome]